MYRTLIFDLDGTLTDSAPGITNSVAFALKRFGIEEPDRAKLLRFVGPPLRDSFQKYYSMTPEEAETAIRYYREYFTSGGMFENRVYPGIPELLERFKAQGRTLLVATSKPILFTETILRHYGLYDFFDRVSGASMDEQLTKKADIIADLLTRFPLDDLSQAVMIGDRREDILGGRSNHLATCGVLYGYGSEEELKTAGADLLAPTVSSLADLV